MTKQALQQSDLQLLRGVISHRDPSLLSLVDRIASAPLTREEREALRDVLAIELTEVGLNADYEPNQTGLMLERLIDQLWYVSTDSSE